MNNHKEKGGMGRKGEEMQKTPLFPLFPISPDYFWLLFSLSSINFSVSMAIKIPTARISSTKNAYCFGIRERTTAVKLKYTQIR